MSINYFPISGQSIFIYFLFKKELKTKPFIEEIHLKPSLLTLPNKIFFKGAASPAVSV